jgi:hypothetical protein
MSSANWWWMIQDQLHMGATIVPPISGLDKKKLTACSCGKAFWPFYLTIKHIHSSIQKKSSYIVQIVLSFLQMPPRLQRNSGSCDPAQRDLYQHMLCDVTKIAQQSVTGSPMGRDITFSSPRPSFNGKSSGWQTILVSCIADHAAHANCKNIM